VRIAFEGTLFLFLQKVIDRLTPADGLGYDKNIKAMEAGRC
jgi:hypothetical protein